MMKVVSIVTRIHARLQRSKYLTAMCVIGVLIVHKDGWPGLRTPALSTVRLCPTSKNVDNLLKVEKVKNESERITWLVHRGL